MDQEKPNGVQVTPSSGGTVRSEGKLSRGEKGYSSPKTSKDVLLKCRLEYEIGSWNSIKELADRHGIHEQSLYTRIRREEWKVKREQILIEAQRKVEQKAVKEASQAEVYLQNSFKRALRLEKIADASLSQASLTNEGIPLVDLEQIDILTRSELRIHELAKSSLRLPSLASQDVTTGGADLGASFVMAIAKLRQDASQPALSGEDLSKVLEAEVE